MSYVIECCSICGHEYIDQAMPIHVYQYRCVTVCRYAQSHVHYIL